MIYLDNAASTPLDPEVIEEINQTMKKFFGNPSSIHQLGRESRVLIEESRRQIAKCLNVTPAEIIFTSGGTEAINIAISNCIYNMGVTEIITSAIEHPAVRNTLKFFEDRKLVKGRFVRVTATGNIDLNHLEELLKSTSPGTVLVCLMHANNEIGNLLPVKETSDICKKYNALFLCDTVQTLCKYKNDFRAMNIDFAACSGHKFYGPKGIGFLYANRNIELKSIIHGGGQERNVRSGTENIYGIAGITKAFEIAHRDMDKNIEYITGIKQFAVQRLRESFTDLQFNGNSETGGLYNILNFSVPGSDKTRMLVQKLDMKGIAISGGSACHSASETVSYVLKEIATDITRTSLRASFSKFNTKEDIEIFVQNLSKILAA